MKAENSARFDVETLRDLAGDRTFARGQAYHRDGQVELLAIEAGRVLARVAGSEDYRTQLIERGDRIGGDCTCPAFDDSGFCKHMVAVGLAANAAGDGGLEDGGPLVRIREYLKTRDVDALVGMILDLAVRDATLFRSLHVASAVATADDGTIEASLRKAIDQATHTDEFIDYQAAGSWADEVDAALDPLDDLLKAGRAEPVVRLAEHAIDLIEESLGYLDDSNGEGGGVLCRAQEIHLAAVLVAKPEPVALAQTLFEREIDGPFDTFSGAVAAYAEALGETGLAEYRRLAALAWEKLPARAGRRGAVHDFDNAAYRLKPIMDFFAERDGDVMARIALRERDLTSPWSYLELARFCLAQGRADEALRRAEEGLWVFEDDRLDERLVRFTADLLAEAGQMDRAEALLRRAFDKAPSRPLYDQVRNRGGEAARDWAIDRLKVRLESTPAASRWNAPADLLVEVLAGEGMMDAAWAIVGSHGASTGRKMDLARASEATHPQQALAVYADHVEDLVSSGSGYAEAVALVGRMAPLQSADQQAAYVAGLKDRHRRKRNFMTLLG